MANLPIYLTLAEAHEQHGKWSKVVSNNIIDRNDLERLLVGDSYFKHGIKPRFSQIGDDLLSEKLHHIESDPVTAIRKLYGVGVQKAYNSCSLLDIPLPIKYVESDLSRSESQYAANDSDSESDCCVRAFTGMLDVPYDTALDLIYSSTNQNSAKEGLDPTLLSIACNDNGLTFFPKTRLFGGRQLVNTSVYELFTMIPDLAEERLCFLTYRHIFYVDCGVAFDLSNYLHNSIHGIVCENSRVRIVEKKISNGLSISPVIQDIAYERWANGTSWADIAFDLRMEVSKVLSVAQNHEYALEIEDLMYNWRSKDEFIHWISTYPNILSRISRRLGMEQDDCEKIILNVQARHGIKSLL